MMTFLITMTLAEFFFELAEGSLAGLFVFEKTEKQL